MGRRRILGVVTSMLALGGCRQLLGIEEPVELRDGGFDAMPDALPPPPDASACPSPSLECANPFTLRECVTVGELPVDRSCGWGCVTPSPGAARCVNLLPAGGAVAVEDLARPPATLGDVVVSSAVSIDGGTGAISNLRDAGDGVIQGIGYVVREEAAVFTFRSLTIDARITLTNTRPFAFAADGEIRVAAVIDVQGACNGTIGGPGGFSGGLPGMAGENGGGSGGGTSGNTSGGGGGGFGASGGKGGDGVSIPGGAGGEVLGNEEIAKFIGGGGGGGGPATSSGVGGGGGGALQLASNTRIVITNAGVINAGGCGGKSGLASGGGGGAGGTILLEAPEISIAGVLTVNGGGGAGGGPGAQPGGNGAPTTTAAPGGAGATSGNAGDGGAGGARAVLVGGAGGNFVSSGGGGGGVGRIRINTRTGGVSILSGNVISPALGEAGSTATSGTARTEPQQ